MTEQGAVTIRKFRGAIFTMENYFSGDKIIDGIGQNGFAATMVCRRDRLPYGVPIK